MDDVVVRNTELEQILEERQAAKKAVAEYKTIDKEAKDKIAALEQKPPYRVGRFIVAQTPIAGRSVSFDTSPGTRISIKLLGDE